MIQLVGPGGAGKTAVGRALGRRLGVRFTDLDEQFQVRAGDISEFLASYGYAAYCTRNVETYLEVVGAAPNEGILALSSGFMTYTDTVHPQYPLAFQAIITSPSTVVLLPSHDRGTCIAEIVRRQVTRPFSRSAEREEAVIRARFDLYRNLPCWQVECVGKIERVVDHLVEDVLTNIRLQPTAAGEIPSRRG
ncbi:MAG: shikimate kinase [Vicinamibacterales bacterium]